MTPLAQPAIAFGTVRHRRLRPVAHEFAARAFFLRLPLRRLARQPWPYRLLARNARARFALDDRDHGDGRPLLAWLEQLLVRAGVHDADGEAWLHCFPRMYGYVFNPVSFWFAERRDGALRAIVCEVNNTFGERHCYVLAHADGRPLAWGETLEARKAFHVSPFCAIAGGYRFRFHLAQRPDGGRFVARIEHTDEHGVLLQTSLSGRLEPLDDRRLARASWTYPLFTFGVIARIHWHALRLWLKGLPAHRKPAPPAGVLTSSLHESRADLQ